MISLDIYAEDNEGKKYNIEIQRSDSGATPKRARFHSSMIDTKLLKKNEKFDNLAETYVIFITENDVIGKGLPLYHFDRYCKVNLQKDSDISKKNKGEKIICADL